MTEKSKVPFESVLAYSDRAGELDCSIPTRIELGWRSPPVGTDEPDWACNRIVEDVATHIRIITEERLDEIVGAASKALARDMGVLFERSDGQLAQLKAVLSDAEFDSHGASDSWQAARGEFAWGAVAETSVLALTDTLATAQNALDGLVGDHLAKECLGSLDGPAFVKAAGIAASDVERAVTISADAMASAVGAIGNFPLMYRQRWLQVGPGSGGSVQVRHFVPGLLEVGGDTEDPAVGMLCRAGMKTFLPVGPDIEFRVADTTITAHLRTGAGRALDGTMVFAREDGDHVIKSHAVCLAAANQYAQQVVAWPTPFGSLWEWDATDYARVGSAGGSGTIEGVADAVDGEPWVRFVQPDPIN